MVSGTGGVRGERAWMGAAWRHRDERKSSRGAWGGAAVPPRPPVLKLVRMATPAKGRGKRRKAGARTAGGKRSDPQRMARAEQEARDFLRERTE